MKTDKKIKDEKLQYVFNRQAVDVDQNTIKK